MYGHKLITQFGKTRAITKRNHTPQQLLVIKQSNVTGMQNKRQKRA